MSTSQPLVGRSVAATSWGKKGVTAKQRQAASRAARLDSGGDVDVDGGSGSGSGSRRNSIDPTAEQQYIRQHIGTDRPANEAEMAPTSPLLNKNESRSVKSFWSSAAPIPKPTFDSHHDSHPNAATTSPVGKHATGHISRPARSRHRLGDGPLSPLSPSSTAATQPNADQTGEVTQVLQSIKARQEAQRQIAPDAPDEESAAIQSAPVRNHAGAIDPSPQRESMEDAADPTAAVAQPAAAPTGHPPTESSLCACCPCIDSFTSASCFGSLRSTFDGFFGVAGRDSALSEMRQGVILPQDASKSNVRAIESQLTKLPEACVLNVRVRRTDELLADAAISHPMVKMHIIDLRTGTYWRKRDRTRHAISPYENMRHTGSTGAAGEVDHVGENSALDSILPIMTHPYKLKSQGGFLPLWDENLLVNEPLRSILDVHSLLLFEIVDFGPLVDLDAHPSGYLPIAWAFLKPISARGEPNIGINQQLQLYRYTNLGASRPSLFPFVGSRSPGDFHKAGVPPVYYEWIWQKHTGRVRYPATFFIDFTGVAPPHREKIRGSRPSLPTQIEEGRMDFNELMATVAPPDEFTGLDAMTADGRRARKRAVEQMTPAQKAAIVRRRKATDACLVPNSLSHEISAGLTGCFVLRYSPDGRTLAAACGDGLMFTIKLYDSDTGAQLFTYVGHHDLIYDLSWNCLGTELVSASSDATAKVWSVDATRSLPSNQLRPHAIATLQHTGFVYACAFHPKLADKGVILTGGFDGAIRVFNNRGDLLHTIAEHKSHINSIVIAPNGTRIFTGDADGTIRVWEDTHYTRATAAGRPEETARPRITDANQTESMPWDARIRPMHTIAPDELKGNIITCIRYHARPERLVVYCRNNSLYVFSLLRYDIRTVLSGVPCHHHSLRFAISPDGDKLVAGGEDGQAYFFDLTRGELERILEVGFHTPLYDIAWHPNQHAIAMASFGGDYPIKIFEYNASKDTRIAASPATAEALASSQRSLTARGHTQRESLPPLHSATLGGSSRAAQSQSQSQSHAYAARPQLQTDRAAAEEERMTDRDRMALGASSKRVHFTQE